MVVKQICPTSIKFGINMFRENQHRSKERNTQREQLLLNHPVTRCNLTTDLLGLKRCNFFFLKDKSGSPAR